MTRLLIFLFTFLFLFNAASYAAPKRELRAAWIATVGNIDWPSKQGLSAQQQQQEFISHINYLQRAGFNAVIVQVRPAADALYESEYEPWSRYLSGKQGLPPFPKYDPMEFMIRECHKRNMEFHAWFNPYRALVTSTANPNPANHVTRTQPDWLIHYAGKSYFDPGNPDAREYILKVILDAVARYDMDAVHIDDYFYPYPVAGKPFPDGATYKKYGNDMSVDDWRRNNVNIFISQLNNGIKKEKSWVKFGVSPFGIWRNQNKDAEGSATRGSSCYDELYSDVRLWLEKKWIDYVAPQLYWERGHRVADYNVLLPWWAQNSNNRQLYIGLGLYRMVNAKTIPWNTANEIIEQIKMARKEGVDGFVFYSMSCFYKIGSQLTDSLQNNYFGSIAIPPAMSWIPHTRVEAPMLTASNTNAGKLLQWNANTKLRYLVYRFEQNEKIDLNQSDNIIALINSNKYIDKPESNNQYKYVVTALDRLWNESTASNIVGSGAE